MGTKLLIKPEIVPHKKLEASSPVPGSQLTSSSKKRKSEAIAAQLVAQVKRNVFGEATPKAGPSSIPVEKTKKIKTCDSPSGKFVVSRPLPEEATISEVATPAKQRTPKKQPVIYRMPSSEGSQSTQSSASFQQSSSEESEELMANKDVILKYQFQLCQVKSRFYLGLPEDVYKLTSCLSNVAGIQIRDVLITLKKIRLSDTFERLGDDFCTSTSNVQKIFASTVPKIANKMQQLVYWPQSSIIKRLLPIPFRKRYREVESIIDCFEIEIQKPSNPLMQALTWSAYKKANTVKYLISATPNGFINFVSTACGGRTTDNEIIKESGYLEELPDGAAVMADRGFKHVAQVLAKKQCTLIRPPSVGTGQRMSSVEAKENKRIAALRIHIERVIRRLREFSMLRPHACVNHQLIEHLDFIVIIACGIVNTQGPLIKT